MREKKMVLALLLLICFVILSGGCGGGGADGDSGGENPSSPTTPPPSDGSSGISGTWSIYDATVTAYDANRNQTEKAYYVRGSAKADSFNIAVQPASGYGATPGLYSIVFTGDGVLGGGIPGAGLVFFSVENTITGFDWNSTNISSIGEFEKINENTYTFTLEVDPAFPLDLQGGTTFQRIDATTLMYTQIAQGSGVTTTIKVTLKNNGEQLPPPPSTPMDGTWEILSATYRLEDGNGNIKTHSSYVPDSSSPEVIDIKVREFAYPDGRHDFDVTLGELDEYGFGGGIAFDVISDKGVLSQKGIGTITKAEKIGENHYRYRFYGGYSTPLHEISYELIDNSTLRYNFEGIRVLGSSDREYEEVILRRK